MRVLKNLFIHIFMNKVALDRGDGSSSSPKFICSGVWDSSRVESHLEGQLASCEQRSRNKRNPASNKEEGMNQLLEVVV